MTPVSGPTVSADVSSSTVPPGRRPAGPGREYALALLGGAAGAGLILLAVRERWAEGVFTPPKPLSTQVINVSGGDLVPLAGALGLVALACLAAVIATRGVLRRITGALLAALGAGAGIAVATGVSAATVVSVAASKVGSPGAAALSQTASGSTTSGSAGGSSSISMTGVAGHAVMTGTPWQVAVFAGALLVVAAGIATAWRGPSWPVMSTRYDAPERHTRKAGPDDLGTADHRDRGRVTQGAGARDSASMWESLSAGADPTDLP